MYKKFIAVNQYGDKVFIENHPRKELMERSGVKHADKMYRNNPDGSARHVGYVVAGNWWEVLKVEPLNK